MSAADLLRKFLDRFAQVERGAVNAFPRSESDEGAADGGSVALAVSVAPQLDAAPDSAKSSPKKMAFLLAIGALVSKMLGFAREILMAQILGATLIADSYRGAVASVIIPLIFIQNESVPAIFIPMYQAAQRRGDERRHLVSISCAATLIGCGVMALIQIFTEQWIAALFGGFSPEAKALTQGFLSVMSWSMPASVLLNALAAGEIAEGQTRISNLRSILLNVSMILGLAVYWLTGWLNSLAWSFMLGFNGLAVWSLWEHHREGSFDYAGFRASHVWEAARDFLRRLRPVAPLPLAEQTQMWVERIAGSRIAVGGVASLDYARTLSETALLIISQPVGLAFMSSYKEGESPRQIEGIARLILTLTIPACAYTFVFAPDIVRLIFFRGAFSESGLMLTSTALRGISAGLWASTLGWILLRQLNSDGRNALATMIVVCAYLANITVNVVVTWILPPLHLGLLLVGFGETMRGLTLLTGTTMVLPDRGKIFSLLPVAAIPAGVMLICGFAIDAEIAPLLPKLLVGGVACVLCTALAALLLLPQIRERCVVKFRQIALGGG
jgi:putative peptidoglycan lipid II flippase